MSRKLLLTFLVLILRSCAPHTAPPATVPQIPVLPACVEAPGLRPPACGFRTQAEHEAWDAANPSTP